MPQTQPRYDKCQVWCDKIDSNYGTSDWAPFYCQTKTGSKPIYLHKGSQEKGTKYTQHVVHIKMGMGDHWPANQESWPSLSYHMDQPFSKFQDGHNMYIVLSPCNMHACRFVLQEVRGEFKLFFKGKQYK